MPGCGGIVRLVRLIGLEKALPILTEGKPMKAAKAQALGIVDELASDQEDMIAGPGPGLKQILNRYRHSIKKALEFPAVLQPLRTMPACYLWLRPVAFRKTKGLLPAPTKIIALAAESTLLDVDTALRIESRGLTKLVVTPEAKNLITTFSSA